VIRDIQLFAVTGDGSQPEPLPVPATAQTIHDAFAGLELGVYSALRTFEHNKFLGLADHLARTEKSMRLLGWQEPLNWGALCRVLHQVCTAYPHPEARVRFDVLAAPAAALGSDSRLLIGLAPMPPVPPILYEQGVVVDIVPALKRKNPLVKDASFVQARARLASPTSTAYEHLLLDNAGNLLEGSGSNFYAARHGVLYTAGTGVLEGITRKMVLQVAQAERIPVVLQAVNVADIPRLDEASLSSSSRGLIPIVQIAGQQIGAGKPGPITQRLWAAYQQVLQAQLRTALEVLGE